MLAAVKRFVGADRAKTDAGGPPALDRVALEGPIAKARERLAAAQAEHEEARARVSAVVVEIEKAQADFDADGSERNADRLLDLGRDRDRARLFSERTQRAVVAADGDVAAAEQARTAAIVAHLQERVESAAPRLQEHWRSKGKPALEAFAEFVAELDAVVADASSAAHELHQMQPDGTPLHAKILGVEALRSVVRSWIAQDVGAPDRLKIERLIGV